MLLPQRQQFFDFVRENPNSWACPHECAVTNLLLLNKRYPPALRPGLLMSPSFW
jgi:hypothetical protein